MGEPKGNIWTTIQAPKRNKKEEKIKVSEWTKDTQKKIVTIYINWTHRVIKRKSVGSNRDGLGCVLYGRKKKLKEEESDGPHHQHVSHFL